MASVNGTAARTAEATCCSTSSSLSVCTNITIKKSGTTVYLPLSPSLLPVAAVLNELLAVFHRTARPVGRSMRLTDLSRDGLQKQGQELA